MTSGPTDSANLVLLVSEADDESLRAFGRALTAAGVRWAITADVYSAVARLSQGDNISHICLDVRMLDERELTLPRVVARYFPAVEVFVPVLDGTSERLAGHAGGLRVLDLPTIVMAFKGLEPPSMVAPAVTSDGPAVETPAAPSPAEEVPAERSVGSTPLPEPEVAGLSTDGGPDAAAPGPSLHDAVRARMAGGETRIAARRTPPGAPSAPTDIAGPRPAVLPWSAPPAQTSLPVTDTAASAAAPTETGGASRGRLSAEEVDALLAEESANDESPDPPEADDPTRPPEVSP